MRLLNVHSLEFRDFYSGPIPSYAIASHRWARNEGEDREATYLDVKEGQNTNTTGFQKVEKFAEYVRTRVFGVEWLWIDTCCINKQDAQEVSESINSMLKWYGESAVCLAYLADVKISNDHESFESSEWFKRGWTLQELLAPRVVVFLSQNWQVLGHKASDTDKNTTVSLHLGPSLNASVAKITSITENVLCDFQRSKSLTVDERLAWMKSRRTTKEEDMWYCLIGIFDAPIGANYGEGEERAKKRLLAEIWKDDAYLEKLPIARGAAFDDRENELVSECLPETRVDLLREIDGWARSKDGARIFWLAGMAGTGKSTIFKTVARRSREQRYLAATFCFKKGEADRGHASRVMSTISAQLARQLPEVRPKVISVLKQDSDVVRKSLREQFQRLILEPLEHFKPSLGSGSAWIIGIDALDECDNESDISILIDLFARLEELKTTNIRLFLTSRPDLPLRLGFGRMLKDTHLDVRLEKISKDHIAHDIGIYLRHKLSEIRSTYVELHGTHAIGHDWPGDDAIETLVEMAQPLFIFAATACRLLAEPDEDPNETLGTVLNHRLDASQLDRTYGPVLERLLLGKTVKQQDAIAHDFRTIVGAIVLLSEPLPIPALSRLLGVPEAKIATRMSRLHSVLDVPAAGDSSGVIRPLHLSFRDYLTDPNTQGKTPFWINEAQTHRTIAKQCLHLLSEVQPLHEDMCAIKEPGTRRVSISREHVADVIPVDVAYACSYWLLHLVKGQEQICDYGQVHAFLQTHFLHWLEALSWLGRLSGAISLLSDLQSLVKDEQSDGLLAFLVDARRFLLQNRYVIDLAPLQIYSSSLAFAPHQSIVRRQFEYKIPRWLSLRPKVMSNWTAEIQKLEGHEDDVSAVAFSPGGEIVASGSHDKTVRLWNTSTGEEMHKLEGHRYGILAIVFPDRQTVVSASADSVRLWNTRTGGLMQKVEVQLEYDKARCKAMTLSRDGRMIVTQSSYGTVQLRNTWTNGKIHEFRRPYSLWGRDAAFSPDMQIVALINDDYDTVKLYDTRTGRDMYELREPRSHTSAVAFSPDGKTIATGSRDHMLRLWRTWTGGGTYEELIGHDEDISAVAFSPDGQTLASVSWGGKIWLWNANTGEKRGKLRGQDEAVNVLAFSPDGQTVVSGSLDSTVRLWNIWEGEEARQIQGHNWSCASVSFSPDGQRVVTGGGDNMIRIWNASTGEETRKIEGHSASVLRAVFSPDGQRIASGSEDCTVRIWDADTGEETLVLKGHKKTVLAVAFSSNKCIASGSTDKTVRLWDSRTGKRIHTLKAHEYVSAVAISPDGRIVAASGYAVVLLWDVRTGAKIHVFPYQGYVWELTFSEDGTSLTTDGGKLDIRPYVSSPQGRNPPRRVPNVSLDGQWIKYQDQDVLWLPQEYRGSSGRVRAACEDTLVFGQRSGAVSFFRLQIE